MQKTHKKFITNDTHFLSYKYHTTFKSQSQSLHQNLHDRRRWHWWVIFRRHRIFLVLIRKILATRCANKRFSILYVCHWTAVTRERRVVLSTKFVVGRRQIFINNCRRGSTNWPHFGPRATNGHRKMSWQVGVREAVAFFVVDIICRHDIVGVDNLRIIRRAKSTGTDDHVELVKKVTWLDTWCVEHGTLARQMHLGHRGRWRQYQRQIVVIVVDQWREHHVAFQRRQFRLKVELALFYRRRIRRQTGRQKFLVTKIGCTVAFQGTSCCCRLPWWHIMIVVTTNFGQWRQQKVIVEITSLGQRMRNGSTKVQLLHCSRCWRFW